jgi:hypothetical protein
MSIPLEWLGALIFFDLYKRSVIAVPVIYYIKQTQLYL